MLAYIVAEDVLTTLGQVSAIILCLYMLVSILIGIGVTAGLMFGLSWVREKAELIKMLRPVVDSVNTTTEEAIKGTLPAPRADENKIVRTVAEIPARLHAIDNKVEEGSDRVLNIAIEISARTMMVKSMAKAFFFPGLKYTEPTPLQVEGPEQRTS
jgi:hypothetical protein